MLEFHNDAIVLSGETGTKLKSGILGKYYWQWWSITSGGESSGFGRNTAIIEMNAGTGEDYIKETNETILGSSGHALSLKAENPDTSKLKVVLVEKNTECFTHLKNVVNRKWPDLQYSTTVEDKTKDVYLLNTDVNAPDLIDHMALGNSLFFFDPLDYTPWSEINRLAKKRIKKFYQTGTEFVAFLFTSDWFLGRGKLVPLPNINDESKWLLEERNTVSQIDDLFGDTQWRPHILNIKPINEKMNVLVNLYRKKLHKWFRYVLPLPFQPKESQLYHLFMCSNYERGINITKDFYTRNTKNPKYSPINKSAHDRFIKLHTEKRRRGSSKSDEWKVLWRIIRNHEEGICDSRCQDILEFFPDFYFLETVLEWLYQKGYIVRINGLTDAWEDVPEIYCLDWNAIKDRLGVDPPPAFTPLSKINSEPDEIPTIDKKQDGLEQWF